MAVQAVKAHDLKDRFLSQKYPPEFLARTLIPREAFHPYPTIEDRSAWESLPQSVRAVHMAQAEAAMSMDWPHLPATLYLRYMREGDRRKYEKPYFARRDALAKMVIAECMEAQGRFLDAIVDALWSICEESSWCIPAHIAPQAAGSTLPDTAEPIVDLFCAETAALIAWTDYLLGERLNTVSPVVRERLWREVNTRFLTPNLERDDFWWMGFAPRQGYPDRRVNNWNPWINSNWLATALLMEKDDQRRVAAVFKILESVDRFVTPYPRDGGCDEGPSYWGRAGASLFDNLELLLLASGGEMDVYGDPLVQEIGRFVYRAHIADDFYVNFADAPARLMPDPLLVFRYGQRMDDELMMGFGAWLAERDEILKYGVMKDGDIKYSLGRAVPALFHLQELKRVEPKPALLRDVWLPEIQVMAARDAQGAAEGFYVAAKGGHNEESHNHNDIGHYVVYIDGKPVIVDAGVETYTRKTFSPQRYEIWTMQSAYHSLPTIDGVMQSPGEAFAASNVSYAQDDASARLTLDIAKAYPPEAGLASWLRVVELKRGACVEVTDTWKLTKPAGEIMFSLITASAVDLSQPGVVKLTELPLVDGRTSGTGQVKYDPRLTASVEEITLSDERLTGIWGTRLARIVFKLANPEIEGTVKFTVTR